MEGEYATIKGQRKFIFLHGHQFDKLFTLPSWRIMPLINNAAMVFGSYTWIFVAFFVIDISLVLSFGLGGLAEGMMLLLLGAIAMPFLAIKFGRNIWNKFKTTRHKPEEARERVKSWWDKLSKQTSSEECNIVYGHTHTIALWSQNIGNGILRLFNIPSWIKDSTKKKRISREIIFRHAFLYIDDENIEFIGWDKRKKRPFLIPKDIVQTRQTKGDLTEIGIPDLETRLREIGWPQPLINKWLGLKEWSEKEIGYNTADAILALLK
jgi:hypothetical protein